MRKVGTFNDSVVCFNTSNELLVGLVLAVGVGYIVHFQEILLRIYLVELLVSQWQTRKLFHFLFY